MKPKTMILMVVAIGCGLAASYMTSRVIAERNNKVTEEEKVTILVAKNNLAIGTLIKDPQECFEERSFIKGQEPKKAIQNFDEVKDHRLIKPLSAEQFVTKEDLTSKDEAGLTNLMKKGMRAISLKVNIDAQVAGFVLPNTRVDIISVSRRHDSETYAKIIMQNVLVLAIDQIQQRPEEKAALVAGTVTVMVTPKDAERLALASELGPLRLILRSYGDEESVSTSGMTPKGIMQPAGKAEDDASLEGPERQGPPKTRVVATPRIKIPEPAPKPEIKTQPALVQPAPAQPVVVAKAPEPPPVKSHTITIYHGDAVSKAVFVLGEKGESSEIKVEKSQPEPVPVKKTNTARAPVKKL